MSRCHRKMVPGVTISRIAARRSIGSVPASRASNARSGHVSRARTLGRSRPATASWWRSMRISASFHHASRRDKPSSDTARETIRKISFKPTSRRSSHLRSGQDRPGACRTLHRALPVFAQVAQVVGTLRPAGPDSAPRRPAGGALLPYPPPGNGSNPPPRFAPLAASGRQLTVCSADSASSGRPVRLPGRCSTR